MLKNRAYSRGPALLKHAIYGPLPAGNGITKTGYR